MERTSEAAKHFFQYELAMIEIVGLCYYRMILGDILILVDRFLFFVRQMKQKKKRISFLQARINVVEKSVFQSVTRWFM